MNDFCYNHDVFSGYFPLEQQHHEQQQSLLSNGWTVQIHTTDITQRVSAGGNNSFRRSNHQASEIKSENIKSENETTSAAKDRSNAISTPPTRNGITEPKKIVGEEKTGAKSNKTPLHTEVFKCENCPFLSLSLGELELHSSTSHDKQEIYENHFIRMKCPGCENIFYVTNSLLVHLQEDHLLSPADAKKLLDMVQKDTEPNVDSIYYTNNSNVHETEAHTISSTSSANVPDNISTTQTSEVLRNGRIYLKNVDCLREPSNDCIESSRNHVSPASENALYDNACSSEINTFAENCGSGLLEGNTNPASSINSEEIALFSNMVPVNKPKQKISIKSVDVLREPTLLRRDFEMQNFPMFTNVNNDLNSSPINTIEQFFAYDNNSIDNANKNNAMTMVCNNNTSNITEVETFEKERRPKIYIKNVDILKKSVEPSHMQNEDTDPNRPLKYNFTPDNISENTANAFLNSGENFSTLTTAFDMCSLPLGGNVSAEQYLFENTNNILQNVGEVEDLSLANGIGSFQLLDDMRFTSSVDCGETSVTPIITEPTPSPPPPPPLPPPPPPPSSSSTSFGVNMICINDFKVSSSSNFQLVEPTISKPKQKIFIKNVDVLKAPQFQETRRTLHLRTVDELNLMNKNEVENLIAPNLESTNDEMASKVSQSMLNESDTNFKLHDFDMNEATGWSTDYDLDEELDCIITETIGPVAQLSGNHNNNSIDSTNTLSPSLTLQKDVMSLLSLSNNNQNTSNRDTLVDPQPHYAQQPVTVVNVETSDVASGENNETTNNMTYKVNSAEVNNVAHCIPDATIVSDVPPPPLVPVTTTCNEQVSEMSMPSATANKMSVPVPPLVPVSPLIQHIRTQQSLDVINNNSQNKTSAVNSSSFTIGNTNEKGRIYVANNLLQPISKSVENQTNLAVSPISGGTSVRGRPFGSKSSNISKSNKRLSTNGDTDNELKCSVPACAFRFKKSTTLDYHKRCHGTSTGMVCPDCSSPFTNWNTLHTHLWRVHQIDMELYSCKLCNFKTPIYSRLVNTHAKIHSDERNYKCDECTKAFKNTKQLKNHRRWHRIHGRPEDNPSINGETPKVHRCADCGSVFSHRKSLQEHSCKVNTQKTPIKCDICDRVLSSKSALKLHKHTHDQTKRYKCTVCSYSTSDHNAYRRHKLTHSNSDNQQFYSCPHCNYKSIQSLCFKNHVQRNHPESVGSTIYKCDICLFSTINRSLYNVHQTKHEMSSNATILNPPHNSVPSSKVTDYDLSNKNQG